MEDRRSFGVALREGGFKPPHAALADDFVNMNGGRVFGESGPRCCASRWRSFWASGVALREEASNHLPGPWLKTVVLNGAGKGAARSRQVWTGKMSDGLKGPLPTEASKANQVTSKPGSGLCSGMSLGVTRLLPRRCPACRQHESGPGSRTEHVKARFDTAAGKGRRRERDLQAAESARS